ncbi:hypothetical protein DID80_05740 [Candidatus Marinamargulisbacteria bacterium SCGC AAA071-K20]|nr:hypothetical protein DID80_05740 [Candidatus Marinamargulisbacteria bacterium SCGC AAA071-K20]
MDMPVYGQPGKQGLLQQLYRKQSNALQDLATRQAQAEAAPAVGAGLGAASTAAILILCCEPICACCVAGWMAFGTGAGAVSGAAVTNVAVQDTSRELARVNSNLARDTAKFATSASTEAYQVCLNTTSFLEKTVFSFSNAITVH